MSDADGLDTAISQAQPGDVIKLADGTYQAPSGNWTAAKDGTASAPITLTGSRNAVLSREDTSSGYGLWVTGNWWVIQGLSVKTAQKGIVIDHALHVVIDGVSVSNIGQEGIHFREFSSDGIARNNEVHDTGLVSPSFGEGLYVGSSQSNWGSLTGGQPDTVDRVLLSNNSIWNTPGECVDIKEATTGGTVAGNSFTNCGNSGSNSADSWVDVKGNDWVIQGNTGSDDGSKAFTDGFTVHRVLTNQGYRNTFRNNIVAGVLKSGYGFAVYPQPNTLDTNISCNNLAPAASKGLSNIPCVPDPTLPKPTTPPLKVDPAPALKGLDLSATNRRTKITGLYDWSKAGYRSGQYPLPGDSDVNHTVTCDITPQLMESKYGVLPNDNRDDTAGVQAAIDDVRTLCTPTASFSKLSRISLPAGTINISRQISVDASYLTISGAGSDPATGSHIIFRPDSNTRYDVITREGSQWDLDNMNNDSANGGWIWPGRGLFRVQSRKVADKYADEYAAARANRKDLYEGTVNDHWINGLTFKENPTRTDPGFAARKGDTSLYLGASTFPKAISTVLDDPARIILANGKQLQGQSLPAPMTLTLNRSTGPDALDYNIGVFVTLDGVSLGNVTTPTFTLSSAQLKSGTAGRHKITVAAVQKYDGDDPIHDRYVAEFQDSSYTPDLSYFKQGSLVNIMAANTLKFYQQMHALPPAQIDYLQRLQMRQQIFRIAAISGNKLTVDKPLEYDVPVSETSDGSPPLECYKSGTAADPNCVVDDDFKPFASKATPLVDAIVGVGFENISLTQDEPGLRREDAVDNYGNMDPAGAMQGIVFKWAADSFVRNIETDMTGSHPIVTEEAKNLTILNNYLDGSWNKGKGGNGYFRGSRVWDSVYAGNTTRNLRHFTFQWSASGNVAVGNSFDSDLNLHGGYERNNLFEMNRVAVSNDHRPGHCASNCGEEGDTDGKKSDPSAWYPIWWAAGIKAVKWSGASGPDNMFFNNSMSKQVVDSQSPYVPFYNDRHTIYRFGSNGADVSGNDYKLLETKPSGASTYSPITDWATNEGADFTGGHGVDISKTDSASSLFLEDVLQLVAPAEGDSTTKSTSLVAEGPVDHPFVSYWFYDSGTAKWLVIPAADVTTDIGGPISWPVARDATATDASGFQPLTWDVAKTRTNINGFIKVRACVYDTRADGQAYSLNQASTTGVLCTVPNRVQLATHAFGGAYATQDLGPGTLAEVTGDFSTTATDVNVSSYIGSISFGRTFTTLHPAAGTLDSSGVFGPGWVADLPDPGAGAVGYRLTDGVDGTTAGYAILTAADGSQLIYDSAPTVSGKTTLTGVGTAADGSVLVKDATVTPATFALTDTDGAKTVWKAVGSAASLSWQLQNVTQAGSATQTTFTYVNNRVTQALAPVPAGISCGATPRTVPGCRTLTFNYADETITAGKVNRLDSVDFTAADPVTGTMTTVPVAHYHYNNVGQLDQAWDPRTETAPLTNALKTSYTYGTDSRLKTISPPGLNSWTLSYDTRGRLIALSRTVPVGASTATAKTSIVYDVPPNGQGSRPDLTANTTGMWGQSVDVPASGVAVFSPDHPPAGAPTIASAVTDADWPYASLSYFDTNGRETNSANYGAGAWQIDATQYDQADNVTWSLSAGNLARALDPTSASTPSIVTPGLVAAMGSSVDRANALASLSVYTPDGVDQTDTYGPTTPVVLDDGSSVDARVHSHTAYDESAPAGGPFHLATTVTATALTLDGVDHDPKVTKYGYSKINPSNATEGDGWTLRQPVQSTTVMAQGSNLTTATRYNNVGQVTESRLPGSSAGATPQDAHTMFTGYYTATGSGACVSPSQTGLVCNTNPGAQPASGKPLPTTTFTYNIWDEPLLATETYGSSGVTRTTTSTYDPAARPSTVLFAATPVSEGGGTLTKRTYDYYSASGLPSTVKTSSTLTTAYNAVGAVNSYTDADGNVSKTTYDIDGRPMTFDDGKGITTYTYDGSDANGQTEHRGLITQIDAGIGAAGPDVFNGAYDSDGRLALQILPNGIRQQANTDTGGGTRQLSYRRAADSSTGTAWLNFTVAQSAVGQVRQTSSPQSVQIFTYDTASRLVAVQDNVAPSVGGNKSCTTRTYSYDGDSNRTAQSWSPAASGGGCSTAVVNSAGHSYDTADRLIDSGTVYDTFGRTLTISAADAKGGVAPVSATYYVNDMVATLTQGSSSASYGLDPLHSRVRTATSSGTTTTNHYSGSADSPSWSTDQNGNWTRNIIGLDGALALQETGTSAGPSAATVQVHNPHGDVVALAADVANFSTSYRTFAETTEFGELRGAGSGGTTGQPAPIGRYGWFGGAQRSSDTPGGLVLMGARVYNPTTGRFLQVDPVYGGSANDYDYCNQDPLNESDISGNATFYGGGSGGGAYAPVFPVDRGRLGAGLGVAAIAAGVGAAVHAVTKVIPKPNPNSKKAKNDSSDYIVYRISDGTGAVWKYGISRNTDESRPKVQLPKCRAATSSLCSYAVLNYVGGFYKARVLEAAYIAQYAKIHGHCPPGQLVSCR